MYTEGCDVIGGGDLVNAPAEVWLYDFRATVLCVVHKNQDC